MEQMYLIEIFIDKVTIFLSEEDEKSGAEKNLIVKIKFGPKVQFIVKEGQLAVSDVQKDDIVECDANGRRKWTRTIRVGKSFLFPSYPDTILMILSKFPLEIEVWNDDENEVDIFVGIGTMYWDTQFYHMLKESSEACKLHEPLSIKQSTPIFAECCCRQVGEVTFILRLSALGDSIITEFQQLMKDPESFVFRTNKAPSMFKCKRVEGDDPNFCMIGSLYETATLEDPDVIKIAQNKIEVCTELHSCGQTNKEHTCEHHEEKPKKHYPIDKIRMGDITGPCGNTNCALANKVKNYIRSLEIYKKETAGKIMENKGESSKTICGTCDCKDDRWHRSECPTTIQQTKITCSGCGGLTTTGDTCETRKNKFYGTGITPKSSKTVAYIYSATGFPNYKESTLRKEFLEQNLATNLNIQSDIFSSAKSKCSLSPCEFCNCTRSQDTNRTLLSNPDSALCVSNNNRKLCNAETLESVRAYDVFNACTSIADDKDCTCKPPKPSPPCKTIDCDCITETSNMLARKKHKSYCPLYKHKSNCPVMINNDVEEKKEDEEDETEPLPYGLPPIKLGPCPVLGRPCTVPDGFARMYKTATLPAAPPSYSDAGKVCCSKEYERIKKAIKEYMNKEKDHDYRCINKFNVDTERRCCDKEQTLMSLMGKSCCGSHKIAIQEKFKVDKH